MSHVDEYNSYALTIVFSLENSYNTVTYPAVLSPNELSEIVV